MRRRRAGPPGLPHRFDVQVGPVAYRIGSAWRAPVEALGALYRDFPPPTRVPDYSVRLEPHRPWRRFIRPQVAIAGDFTLPDALPLPLAHGLLAAEMAMNLQLALGERRFLLLHAGSVERDGRVVILTGESGAGKSTLTTLLGENGWTYRGDEFVLLEPETGLAHAFPRPASLKNAAIDEVARVVDSARFGPVLGGTPKGRIRHLAPRSEALASPPAAPALVVFPRFGLREAVRSVPRSECFVRLTQASTNYVALGERGFEALTALVGGTPAVAIDYPDTATGLSLVETLAAP